jgi:hypothetical protein
MISVRSCGKYVFLFSDRNTQSYTKVQKQSVVMGCEVVL